MAKRKPPKTRRAHAPGTGVEGYVSVLVALRPDQRQALVALAEERRKPGEPPPISEVVREALDRGLGIRGPLTPRPPPPVAVRVTLSPRRKK